MFKQPTPQEVKERYHSLPADIQAAISSNEVSAALEALGVKYGLRVDKIGDMIDEVGLVMLGFKKTKEFIRSLSKRLDIDNETAESLAIDVDNEVFKKIRESLRTVQFTPKELTEDKVDSDAGHSPARDSLLNEIERHGAEGIPDAQPVAPLGFKSESDYSVESFINPPEKEVYESAPTPYEQTISEEDKADPTKSFKDHLEKKVEAAAPQVSADPYRESVL